MAGQNINSSIDNLIDQWQGRFAELQKKQTAGETITEDNVRDVIMETGKNIYAAGITEADVEASGHRVDEFKSIMGRVSSTKFKAGTSAAGTPSSEKDVNAIQLAALNDTSAEPSGLPQPKESPLPQAQSIAVSSGMHGRVINPLPHDEAASGQATNEELVMDQAYTISKSTLEKMAPPSAAAAAGATDTPTMESSLAQAAISDQLFKIPRTGDDGAANSDTKPVVMSSAARGPGDEVEVLIRMPVQVISPTAIDPKNFSSPI